MAKLSAVGIGVLAIALALAGGAGFNISVLVGMAFCYASSVNFPALLLALWWPRFNTMGAVVGMSSGSDRLDRADRAERAGVARGRLRHRVAAR